MGKRGSIFVHLRGVKRSGGGGNGVPWTPFLAFTTPVQSIGYGEA